MLIKYSLYIIIPLVFFWLLIKLYFLNIDKEEQYLVIDKENTSNYDEYFIDYSDVDIYDLSHTQENESSYGLWNKASRKFTMTEIVVYIDRNGKKEKYSKKFTIEFDKINNALIGNLGVRLLINKNNKSKFLFKVG